MKLTIVRGLLWRTVVARCGVIWGCLGGGSSLRVRPGLGISMILAGHGRRGLRLPRRVVLLLVLRWVVGLLSLRRQGRRLAMIASLRRPLGWRSLAHVWGGRG